MAGRRKPAQQLKQVRAPEPRRAGLVLPIAVVAAVVLAVFAARTPYLPGDIEATRALQSWFGSDTGWAQWITETTKHPWLFVLAGAVAAISWSIAGWRAALLAIVCFGGALLAGPWLQTWIARPRPTPEYVRVVVASPGYSFPSLFALVYGSTIGYLVMLAAAKTRERERAIWITIGVALLVAGGAARIVLGAHWPSDVLISYLMVLVWAALLGRFA